MDNNYGRDQFLEKMVSEGPFGEVTFILKSERWEEATHVKSAKIISLT